MVGAIYAARNHKSIRAAFFPQFSRENNDMTIVRTSLGTTESARRERFEPTGTISSTNTQKAVEEVASDAAAAVAALGNPLDVFIVIGDSNAVGQGVSGTAPTVQTGTVLQYSAAGAISDANDPTLSAVDAAQNANTGSCWPAFGNAYYRATRRKVGLVLCGVSGSTQTAAADFGSGNWDSTGTLFTAAVNAYTAAVAAFTAAGYSVSLRGVIPNLGANDAKQINASVIVVGDYQTALTNHLARWRSTLSIPQLPIYLVRTGANLLEIDAGYAAVRAAQDTVVAADLYSRFCFISTYDFVARSMMSSGAHYTQPGYNELGEISAANIITDQSRTVFQRNGNDLTWSLGNVAIGYPVADASFCVNPNLGTAAKVAPANAIGHVTGLSGAVRTFAWDGYGGAVVLTGRTSLGTISAPTAVTADTLLFSTTAIGYNGSAFPSGNSAFLGFYASQTHTGSAAGSYARINTTPNGSTTNQEVMRWGNDGSVTVGYPISDATFCVNPNTANAPKAAAANSPGHIVGLSGGTRTLPFDGYGGALVLQCRTSLGTIGAPTAVTLDTLIGAYTALGYNGSAFPAANSAFIGFYASETHSGTAAGSYARVNTTPNTTTTSVESMRWQNSGGVSLGTTNDPGIGNFLALNSLRAGVAGTAIGSLLLSGNTSGTVTIQPQAAAGTPTLTLPNASGTFAISASGNVALNSTTGALSGATNGTTNAMLAQMPANTIKLNNTGSTANAIDGTVTQAAAMLDSPSGTVTVAVDFNAANTDHAITVPTRMTKYRIQVGYINNTGTTASITTARGGLFTQTGGAGTGLVADQALSALTSNAADTVGNALQVAPLSTVVLTRASTPIVYWRTSTAQGAAASGTATMQFVPVG